MRIIYPRKDKYLVQTRSQVRSSGIKLPEIHGVNKGSNHTSSQNVTKTRYQHHLHKVIPPTHTTQPVDKGPCLHILFLRPRIGQGRARLRRKIKTNQPIPSPKQMLAQPILTEHAPKDSSVIA